MPNASKQLSDQDILSKLNQLLGAAGTNHYERIALADQLLKRKSWINAPDGGNGSYDRAIDIIEDQFFGDIAGLRSLADMLDLYHHVPDIEKWRQARFNINRLWAEWHTSQRPVVVSRVARQPTEAVDGMIDPEELVTMTPSRVKHEQERNIRLVKKLRQEIESLHAQIAVKDAIIADLRSRLKPYLDLARKLEVA